ncbi:MAG TPA: PH domain-containing protein [Aggregatilinea sp.]|jgi:uncharacterized membrane protein YdbT with pleckstrin-like domain|uniref:PH domain-containing protein n=1 Tax=Aggregatilinea sp. TaxID=2806333 RepID=UPI002C3F1B06|nr:PH domain-containing protein [Aggregatilinea sp.]HML22741.1 PH domain-containing protein [Aggregatilinea sp.]
MNAETIIAIRRQSKRSPKYWLKAIFSLGIWLIWWRNNYLALTNRALVRRKGVFVKYERAVPLNRVQDISISYGFIPRLLGHGDIRIETAGTEGTEIIMNDVPDPDGFRSLIFEEIDVFYSDDNGIPEKPKSGA